MHSDDVNTIPEIRAYANHTARPDPYRFGSCHFDFIAIRFQGLAGVPLQQITFGCRVLPFGHT